MGRVVERNMKRGKMRRGKYDKGKTGRGKIGVLGVYMDRKTRRYQYRKMLVGGTVPG